MNGENQWDNRRAEHGLAEQTDDMKLFKPGAKLLPALLSHRVRGWAFWKRTGIRNFVNTANAPNSGVWETGNIALQCGAIADYTAVTVGNDLGSLVKPRLYALCIAGADAWHYRLSTADNDPCIGVCTDAPSATDEWVNVQLLAPGRVVFMTAGAAISQYAWVQSNGTTFYGTIKTATTGGFVVGKALLAAGALGDVIPVMMADSWLAHA